MVEFPLPGDEERNRLVRLYFEKYVLQQLVEGSGGGRKIRVEEMDYGKLCTGKCSQSCLSSQFGFSVLPQMLNTQKMYRFISICISIFNFEVFKMGFKWGYDSPHHLSPQIAFKFHD